MNNLIIAVIAIAFSALIMTAGINYLTPDTSVSLAATDTINQVEDMVTDYHNLQINVGRQSVSPGDYLTVYGAQSQNASYTNDGVTVSHSFEIAPGAQMNLKFVKGCNNILVNGQPTDCFTWNTTTTTLAAEQASCQVLKKVQRQMQSSGNYAFNIAASPVTCN
jgi:hypothetical protein